MIAADRNDRGDDAPLIALDVVNNERKRLRRSDERIGVALRKNERQFRSSERRRNRRTVDGDLGGCER
jgi:hypothetical protein